MTYVSVMARRRRHRTGGVSSGIGGVVLFFGAALAALAVAALVADVAPLLSGGTARATAAGELWFRFDPGSLNFTQAIVQRYISPALWDPTIVGILRSPAWLVLGLPGAVLLLLGGWLRAR